MKEMTYTTKGHMREELLCRIVDADAYIQEYTEMIQWPVNSCLE
jgi:hypothetical protein